jgi:isopenicillin-N epimerase
MLDRRDFLSSLMAVAGAAPALRWDSASENILAGIPEKLPDKSLYDTNEEAYWSELRRQFLISRDEVYLNNGTVGSSPAPVLRAVIAGYRDAERLAQPDPEDYPNLGLCRVE